MKIYASSLVLSVYAICACVSEPDGPQPPDLELSETATAHAVPAVASASSTGCTITQSPNFGGGNPSLQINPRSAIASQFTRSLSPAFLRQGSWSAGQFVVDTNGLTFPAVVANGITSGWMSLPFNSGETLLGVSLTICNDATTYIIGDTMATQFSIASRDNWTDGLSGTGSIITGGTPGVWREVDIGMEPLLLNDDSTLWLRLTAAQGSMASPPPPISVAVSQVTLHLNH